MSDILVIGGSNIDYVATSSNPLILRDSNIGTVNVSFGGVGRNTVENLARIGDKVSFITAIGNDSNGLALAENLRKLGVSIYSAEYSNQTPSYFAINDSNHDMHVAVCDSVILDRMTVDDIKMFDDVISRHSKIVLDANINETVLSYIFDTYMNCSFYVEGVSANKVVRFRNYLSRIECFKSNVMEVGYLLEKSRTPEELALELLSRGVKQVVLTDGSKDIIYAENKKTYRVSVEPLDNVCSANGAGDSLFAGLVHGLYSNMSLRDSVLFGKKCAEITLQCPYAVNPKLGELINK